MSHADIRESLISAVNADFVAAYPNVPIVYDNAPFDRNKLPDAWVEYEIKFSGSEQIGASISPKTRIHGFVYATAWVREGTGSKRALSMIDWFAVRLGYLVVDGIQLQAAEPVGNTGVPKGWYMECLKLYFFSRPT